MPPLQEKNRQQMQFSQTNSKYMRKLTRSQKVSDNEISFLPLKQENYFQSTLNNNCMDKAGFHDPLLEYSE